MVYYGFIWFYDGFYIMTYMVYIHKISIYKLYVVSHDMALSWLNYGFTMPFMLGS